MRTPRLTLALLLAATLVALAAPARAQVVGLNNHGPYHWPQDVFEDFGQPSMQGWWYALNDYQANQHFLPLFFDGESETWVDPRSGPGGPGIYFSDGRYEVIPKGQQKVKIGLHPNVMQDLLDGLGPEWMFRVHARARPGGCSLRVFLVPSGLEFSGFPTDIGAIQVLFESTYGPNEPIRELIPIRIGPDGILPHCNWIIAEFDDPDPEDDDDDDGCCFGDPPPWNEDHVAVAPTEGFEPPKISFYPIRCPLVTEVVTAPAGAKFVEIQNRNPHFVDLEFGFLSNSPLYYGVTTQDGSVDTLSGSGGFWNARFPPGFWLEPGERAVVAVGGATAFEAAYGKKPDFELIDTDPEVPDMIPAFPGSVGPAPDLFSTSGLVMLYGWIEPNDFVCDCDYAHWGSGDKVVKTGVSVDGIDADATPSPYFDDTAAAAQIPLAIAATGHADGESFHRRELEPIEGMEKQDGPYNGCGPVRGVTAHDETSENLGGGMGTWMTICGPTPGMPPGEEGVCEPMGTGFEMDVDPLDPAPAIPLEAAPAGCKKLLVVYSSAPGAGKGSPGFRVKDTSVAFRPKDKKWMKKVLKKLVPESSTIYVTAMCKETGDTVELGKLYVMAPTPPSLASPADMAALPGDPPPAFDIDTGSGVKCWLEFAADAAFSKVAKGLKVKSVPVALSKGKWKGVRKKLDKGGAAGTGYWRVRCLDAIGREVLSGVRSFTYESP